MIYIISLYTIGCFISAGVMQLGSGGQAVKHAKYFIPAMLLSWLTPLILYAYHKYTGR